MAGRALDWELGKLGVGFRYVTGSQYSPEQNTSPCFFICKTMMTMTELCESIWPY